MSISLFSDIRTSQNPFLPGLIVKVLYVGYKTFWYEQLSNITNDGATKYVKKSLSCKAYSFTLGQDVPQFYRIHSNLS